VLWSNILRASILMNLVREIVDMRPRLLAVSRDDAASQRLDAFDGSLAFIDAIPFSIERTQTCDHG